MEFRGIDKFGILKIIHLNLVFMYLIDDNVLFGQTILEMLNFALILIP